jgi:hypothetical protein
MPIKQRLLVALGTSMICTLCAVFLYLASHYFHFIRIIAALSILLILSGILATLTLFYYYVKAK